MAAALSVRDLPVEGAKVLMRVDFNVPLDSDQAISDDARIRASLPTIRHILERGGAVILMSHLGRPKGKRVEALSLRPVAQRLEQLLQHPVALASDCIGAEVRAKAASLEPGQVLLLENLRFHEAETKPDTDPSFAAQLAALGDLYVNDAFGTAHRAHSSTVKVAEAFVGRAAPGFLLEREISILGKLISAPERPFIAIVGGAKVSSKLGVLRALIGKVDTLIVGGAMAFTFLKAQGRAIGASLCEEDLLDTAREVMAACKQQGVQLLLPVDVVVAKECAVGVESQVVEMEGGIPDGMMGLDIGPQTVARFVAACESGKTVLWNGPMGVFEISPFDTGTVAVAKALAKLSAMTVVGGGDSVAAVHRAGVADQMTHLSTGGGACLELIEYGKLPGIEVLARPAPSV